MLFGEPPPDDEYCRLVRQIPPPSEEQMRRFATFVSDDHSWYKHLPLTGKGEPFVLYLDPWVHEEYVETEDGLGAWREIVPGTSTRGFPTWAIDLQPGDIEPDFLPPMAHLSRGHTTHEYRDRYGCWSYWNFGSPDEVRHVSIANARERLRVRDEYNDRVVLPAEAIDRGLVYLRATVSPGLGPMEEEYESLRRVHELPLAHDDRALQLEAMVMAMQDVVAWIYEDD